MIVTLTQQEIDDYDEQYDGSMLVAGVPVYCDGEMYFTVDEVERAIWGIYDTLLSHDWLEESEASLRADLAALKAAKLELRG